MTYERYEQIRSSAITSGLPAESSNLPDPDIIAAEIAEDLRSALEQFEAITGDLNAKSAGL